MNHLEFPSGSPRFGLFPDPEPDPAPVGPTAGPLDGLLEQLLAIGEPMTVSVNLRGKSFTLAVREGEAPAPARAAPARALTAKDRETLRALEWQTLGVKQLASRLGTPHKAGLQVRLTKLRKAKFLDHDGTGYLLTDLGRQALAAAPIAPAMPSLTPRDREVLRAVGSDCLLAKQIASRLGATKNSSFRNRLTRLRKLKVLGNDGRGYYLTDLGRHAIASPVNTRQEKGAP